MPSKVDTSWICQHLEMGGQGRLRECEDCRRKRHRETNERWRKKMRAQGVQFRHGLVYPPGHPRHRTAQEISDDELDRKAALWLEAHA